MNNVNQIINHALRPILVALCILLYSCSDTVQQDDISPAPSDTAPSQAISDTPAPKPGEQPISAPELIAHSKQSSAAAMAGLSGNNKPNGVEQRYRRGITTTVPDHIPKRPDELDLVLLDPSPEGWLALYEGETRELSDVPEYRAALYAHEGGRKWLLDLNQFFSGASNLEVQDIRYDDGALYFNAACNTYSADADGQCSWLFRVDPNSKRIDWRTPPLTSNNIFILHDRWVIAGYGFTNEPDSLYLIDRSSGRITWRYELDSAHGYLEVIDDVLHVVTYDGYYRFRLPGGDAGM